MESHGEEVRSFCVILQILHKVCQSDLLFDKQSRKGLGVVLGETKRYTLGHQGFRTHNPFGCGSNTPPRYSPTPPGDTGKNASDKRGNSEKR